MRFGMRNRTSRQDLNKGLMEVMAEMSELEGKFDEAARYYLQAAKEHANKSDLASYDRCFEAYRECQTKAGYAFQTLTFNVR